MRKSIILLLMSLLSVVASAETVKINGIKYNIIKKAKIAEVGRNSQISGVVNIPETITYEGVECSVTSIVEKAFYDCSGLTSVIIPNSVTSIGELAFYHCSSLASITIGNSVTNIGSNAFGVCNSLKKVIISDIAAWHGITFSNGDANPLSQAHHLFTNETTEITELVIPNVVTSIGVYAFYGCSGLTSVTIPNSVTSIGQNAFSSCSGLASITIGSGVTSIGYDAFKNCYGLKKVIVLDIVAWHGISFANEYANPLSQAHHFYTNETTEIKELVIPYDVINIGKYAFVGCSGLTSVFIGNSVTSIGKSSFSNCDRLTSVIIGNSVTSIGESSFSNCNRLTSVTIGSGVKNFENNAFDGCDNLKKVIVPDIAAWCGISFNLDLLNNNPLSIAGHLYSDEKTEIINLIIPDGVTYIGDGVFKGCKRLTSVSIGNSVTNIGVSAFSDCSGLTSVTIPNSVTNIGRGAFNYCLSLTSVTIPNSVTSIGGGAFYNCSGLTSVTIGKNVKKIGEDAFMFSHNIKKVIVPDIASWCGITFENVTANPLNFAHYLYSDEETEITNLVIPDNVTSIGKYVFRGCRNLISITIPNSVKSIGEQAIAYCNCLTSVSIGNGINKIDTETFANCSELTTVYCYAKEVPSTVSNAFNGSYIEYATLHVPESSIEQYKGKVPWRSFGTIIPITDEDAITEIKASEGTRKDAFFDISGRCIYKPQKGLNIINGKKVLIIK